MVSESVIVVVGCCASVASYYMGRIRQLSQDDAAAAKARKIAEKAEKLCAEIPEDGPIAWTKVIYRIKAPKNPDRALWIRCRRCGWSYELQPDTLALCGCESHTKPHFHYVCVACKGRVLVRARDDIDEGDAHFGEEIAGVDSKGTAIGDASVTPSVDNNVCECGCGDATSVETGCAVPQWQCMQCLRLRPKLIGGVTPHAT
jgi:hypothetical protein